MAYKSDELRYAIYARHGDMCSLEDEYGHHDSLGCASKMKSNDYVLVARFAYLTEAIDYAQLVSSGSRGVRVHLRSQRYGSKSYDVSEYPKDVSMPVAIAAHVTSEVQS